MVTSDKSIRGNLCACMHCVSNRGTLFTKGEQFSPVHFVRGTIFTGKYCPGGHFLRGGTLFPPTLETRWQLQSMYSTSVYTGNKC